MYDPSHQNEIQMRDQTRSSLRDAHLKSPTAALAKALQCLEQSEGELAARSEWSFENVGLHVFAVFAFAFGGMNFQDDVDENVSVTSGSMSPDLGDVWMYGCPKRPYWDSDFEVWTEGEELSENNEEVSKLNTKGLQKVWARPCWEGMCHFSGFSGCRGNAGQQLEHFQ